MVKLNRIYTRTGDEGTTGLVDGSRLSKHAPRMAAVGDVDETNAVIGLAIREMSGRAADDLRRVQNDLFDLGADLATPAKEGDDFAPSQMVLRIVPSQVEWVEQRIDAVTSELEPLTSFILPGGSEAAARLHLARTVTRRAERALTALAEQEPVNPAALSYVNRLSDYLFVLARAANDGGNADILWAPGAGR
ncbi:cob(I)yrinic acid a,c-diamide adenosyltransferase [Aurantiacibacter spongiae]|uniref:Corrinoid adenosyltransferase n=1 Tax=Aurantiacibacter spongiae TaxID=2488860 RepID=A0A3N5CQ87_9SPHN|nr:cob(I)yrinic acid a,c-diamide adenosyltransferase [Aurantiacibacter spongiae]RPF71213.1 cob(I)yrinic acid a,c-diamide adenosyltransferase [Aurantiacibacter spongiae]